MATIFSRIVAGEIPSHKVAEDDEFFAFLDINPVCYMTGMITGTVYTVGTGMPFGSPNPIRRCKMKL